MLTMFKQKKLQEKEVITTKRQITYNKQMRQGALRNGRLCDEGWVQYEG